jgi:hypothetical protein
LPGYPSQKAPVAKPALSRKGKQREPAAPLIYDNLGNLFAGAVSLARPEY